MVSFDLRKAFDTAHSKFVLGKLMNLELDSISMNWFISYLNEYKQYVEINICESSKNDTFYGIPQGTILKPTPFFNSCEFTVMFAIVWTLRLYADDTIPV